MCKLGSHRIICFSGLISPSEKGVGGGGGECEGVEMQQAHSNLEQNRTSNNFFSELEGRHGSPRRSMKTTRNSARRSHRTSTIFVTTRFFDKRDISTYQRALSIKRSSGLGSRRKTFTSALVYALGSSLIDRRATDRAKQCWANRGQIGIRSGS